MGKQVQEKMAEVVPAWKAQTFLGVGLLAGFVLGMVFGGGLLIGQGVFNAGHFAGKWQAERDYRNAVSEAELFQKTGYHNMREMLDDYLDRQGALDEYYACRRQVDEV